MKWLIIAFLLVAGILLMQNGTDKTAKEAVETYHTYTVAEQTEEKIKTLCERVAGAGETSVAVTVKEDDGASVICGVGVVCTGGDDPEVVNRLLSLISAACNVTTNRIYIAPNEK
ncbi:MAG: hypothetical protein U0M06_13770 [Clostridia bacterium]|nr:hypothetical protein [Clostridia bacterium]